MAFSDLKDVDLWSVARPYLYSTSFQVTAADADVGSSDSVNVTTGFRSVAFTVEQGLMLNGKRTKMRGFCDHENFGGVGSAVHDRINLFRVQVEGQPG